MIGEGAVREWGRVVSQGGESALRICSFEVLKPFVRTCEINPLTIHPPCTV
jgi:hypothetical protein